jgi:hypothetical protein
LVLELLEGGSLADLLARRGRLRPGEVVTTVAPVAAAVAHAHEQGIVHGDLSPGNVVFTGEGRPVLTDLGVARLLDEDAAAQVTPAYVDPTVARGGAVGPASDVFGLAAAAFHALTGVAPWNGATPADVLAVASDGLLPDLDELAPEAPPELRAVIARGLAADPHDRGSAAAFALDLRHACRPEPVRLAGGQGAEALGVAALPSAELTHQVPGRRPRPAPEVVVPTRRYAWDRARRLRSIGGVAVLAVLLASAAVWTLGRSTTPDAAAQQPPRAVASSSVANSPATRSSAAPHADEPGRDADPDSPAAWRAVVKELYASRAEAYRSMSVDLLDGVYTDGSALRAADSAEITGLRSSGGQVRGFAPEVVEIRSATTAGQRAELRLVDRWPAYTVLDANRIAQSVPARGERPVAMVLVRNEDGWRIDSAGLLP